MKVFHLLFFVCAFLANSNLIKAGNEPVAGILLTNPAAENKISLYRNTNSAAEAYTEFTTKGDSVCLFIPQGKYAYFKADDATITPDEHNLIVKITFFDEGYGTLSFHYNAVNGINYEQQNLKKTNSNTWITATIGITSASFRNAQNNQADFRVNENNYIRSIVILKGSFNPAEEKVPVTSGSYYSEFKGKSVAGYQAWFTSGPTNSNWVHWSANTRPAKGNLSFEIYPDVSDYNVSNLQQTGFANLGNGESSRLFSSADVIDTHFKWMKDTGIDGIALQRFIGNTSYPVIASSQSVVQKVKRAAEKHEKIFYICYDMSSGQDENAWVQSIKSDWVYNIEQTNYLTSSPAYATVNNKPVVQIWGPGFTSRVGNAAGTIELIKFLQSRGCYVIGGVPTNWRTESGDSKPGFMAAYKSYDMVSPWTPGRYKGIEGCDNFKINYLVPDKSFCDANHLDYMPVVFPGFGWSNWNNGAPNAFPRLAGEFLWRQARNIKTTGLSQMYVAMFDEYDEGTAIMKAATDWSMVPADQYFLTLSTDGIWLSSDFYLRLAGAASAMLKSQGNPPEVVTIPFSKGPVYYRNGFEKRYTLWKEQTTGPVYNGVFNLDPCFYRDKLFSYNMVNQPICEIREDVANAHSGDYAVKVTGNPTSSVSSFADYIISEVNIPVVEKMKFSFWKNSINELGRYVTLDLLFESGKRLSQLVAYSDQNGISMNPATGHGKAGAGYEQFICEIGKGELIGDKITAILVSYNKATVSDSYLAWLDDILLATENISSPTAISHLEKADFRITVANQTLIFSDFLRHSEVTIFTVTGEALKTFRLENTKVPVQLKSGIYLIRVTSGSRIYSRKVFIGK
jgi:hypothetical protein